MKVPGGFLVQGQQPLALLAEVGAPPLFRHLQARPLGQQAHRVGKGKIFDLHDEVDDAAALAAAEAVVDLLLRHHMKRGGPLPVEGAQPPKAPALGRQGHIVGHHVGDVAPGGELVDELRRNGQGCPPFVVSLPNFDRAIPRKHCHGFFLYFTDQDTGIKARENFSTA